MKRKYYYIIAVIIVLIAMIIIPSMKKTPVSETPVPENPFPISEDSINTAIKNTGLEITLGEKTDISSAEINSIAYFLMNKDNKMVGTLMLIHNDDIRNISISLTHESTNLREPISSEDFPKIVSMATELYGGFSDNSQIYKDFLKEFDSKNMPKSTTKYWDKKYGDIICSVSAITDGKEPITPIPIDISIMNEAMHQSNITNMEKYIKATEERLASFPERNTKEAQDNLASQKNRLEELKK